MFDAESARSVRERPDNPDASDLLLRAWSAWRRGPTPSHRAEAIALYERALRLDPKSVRAMCGLVDEALNSFVIPDYPTRGNENLIERAASLVTDAVTIEPGSERVMYQEGMLLRAQGNWKEALAKLQYSGRVVSTYSWPLQAAWLYYFGPRPSGGSNSLPPEVCPC